VVTSDRSIVLLGTPIDDVTMTEAIARIADMIATGRATRRVHQVATINVDFVVNATKDPALLHLMGRTDLAIPDGMGILWGARLIGVPLRERTSGVDLVPALAERASVEDWRVCLFGGGPGVAERAARMLTERYPGADVVGLPAPMVAADGTMDGSALEPIRELDPDVVAVALGNPKQEHWIARHGKALGAPVCIGIGGSLDFLTGVTRRAPEWMQRWGLEWIHRALSEPRRLAGRYAKDLVVFGPGILRQAWRGRAQRPAAQPRPTRDGEVVRLDLGALDAIDNATLAAIVGIGRQARRRGERIEVVGLTPASEASAGRLGAAHLLGAD
jgi:N-acetylglucosaminyldiphosphoundecaprenol N-acetyl-beta-D-mannosaminyltransferase